MTQVDSPRRGTGDPVPTASAAGGPVPAVLPTRARRQRRVTRWRPPWLLLPGGVLMLLIIVVPFLLVLVISLLGLDQYALRQWLDAPFRGFGNYVEALASSPLLWSFWISISFAVLSTLVTVPLGVAAAVATQNGFRGRAVLRSIFLIPYVLPSFVVATVWRTMFQPGGIAVRGLSVVGIHSGLWLNGPLSYWTLVIVEIWASWPFVYLLALSGLQSVGHEVHEAAALDGALWWTKLRYVVLPYLRGPLALACIISVLNHINNFTLPFVLFGVPAPRNVETLPLLTYITSFHDFRFGLSAAMAVLSLVLIAIPLFAYLRAVRLDTGGPDRQ